MKARQSISVELEYTWSVYNRGKTLQMSIIKRPSRRHHFGTRRKVGTQSWSLCCRNSIKIV
jgi:hypothetical protein